MKKYIISSFTLLFLVGCSAMEEAVTSTENVTDVAGETVATPTAEAPMSEEEALLVAEDIERTLYNISIMLYDDSGEVTELAADMRASIANYATESFIEQHVVLHDDLCGTPCYTIEMPGSLSYAWEPVVQFNGADAFSVKFLTANLNLEERHNSFEETVYFKRENDTWKMDAFEQVEKDMNLTKEQIAPYLTQLQYEFSNISLPETIELLGREEVIYRFSDTENEQVELYVVARTGYVQHEYSDVQEVETYGGDVIYDLLFYPWNYEWDKIDTSNPVVADFLARVDEIDMRIYEAQDGEEGLAVAIEMVDDYTALHAEVYETYSETWDAAYRENYEMENRNWYFHFTNSLSDYVPEEATEVDAVLMQAEALKNRIYYILVNEKLS